MRLSEERIKHMLGVARRCEELAYEKGIDDIRGAFLVGILHDIGYEWCDVDEDLHPVLGGIALERCGFKYSEEVRYHGVPETTYKSVMLDILNCSDMQVSDSGELVGFDERLKQVSDKFGEDSREYLDCIFIVEDLRAKGY